MTYALMEKNDITSALPGGALYLVERPRFNPSYIRNLNYSLVWPFEVGPVSWWDQAAIAASQLVQKFTKLAKKWKRETINVSSIQQMVLHPCYQEIIAMGPRAIPLILNQLKREPDFWFWALRALTREDPVTEDIQGDLIEMTKAWLDWGSKHAYL